MGARFAARIGWFTHSGVVIDEDQGADRVVCRLTRGDDAIRKGRTLYVTRFPWGWTQISDQAAADGERDRFRAPLDVELVEDMSQVRGDRARTDEECFGNLRVRVPRRHET